MVKAYRPDIDGLRAIAVLSVLFFHAGFSAFQGGFVGVDVFFVISGFLITGIIKEDVKNHTFSFSKFYGRRARRLIPSLLLTVFLSGIFAFFLLSPQHLSRFGGEVVHSLLSVSNFYFWRESGYFDVTSDYKPLLHTWSLSVEEQFYLFWPISLFYFLRKSEKKALIFLVVVGILSFIANMQYLHKSSAVFYLSPFRAFEFAIGAIVVWLSEYKLKESMREFVSALGLALIGYSIFTFNKNTPFPSYNALIPCLGTAFIIYAGPSKWVGKILDNRIAIQIGLLSYSLYLLHWPILVFYKYAKFADLTFVEKIGICTVSILAAFIMYHLIEQPLRRPKDSRSLSAAGFGLSCALVALFMILPAANMWANGGWSWRFKNTDNLEKYFMPNEFDNYVWINHDQLASAFDNSPLKNVLIIGDSQSADFVNILFESGLQNGFDVRTIKINSRCLPLISSDKRLYLNIVEDWRGRCAKVHDELRDNSNVSKSDTIILAASWTEWSLPYLEETIKYLNTLGNKRIVLVGPKQQTEGGVSVLRRQLTNANLRNVRLSESGEVRRMNNLLQSLSAKFEYLELLKFICDEDKNCRVFTDSGNIIFYDQSHLTPKGARFFGSQLVRSKFEL
ncbi:MAG: acyltransferase family protein [Bacteriovoracaceae bacterium]